MQDKDREKIVREYEALQEQSGEQLNLNKPKKSSIVITALDHNPLGDQESESSGVYRNYYPKNIKQTKKVSLNHRERQ